MDATVDASKFDAADLEFFEQKIRPFALEKHCVECHSQAAAKCESIEGRIARPIVATVCFCGGDSGPAVVPEVNPNESLLLQALRYESDLQMLSAKANCRQSVLADFDRWISRGPP